MQAIPGGNKTLMILISNEIPDKNTDRNMTQPPYRLTTCFSVISNLIPEQGIHDEFAAVLSKLELNVGQELVQIRKLSYGKRIKLAFVFAQNIKTFVICLLMF